MPNGKPFDHPYTDILIHGRRVYSATADDLVREIAAIGTEDDKRRLSEMLIHEYNEHTKPNIRKLESVLTDMAARIRSRPAASNEG